MEYLENRNSFRDAVLGNRKILFTFEVVPPLLNSYASKAAVQRLDDLCRQFCPYVSQVDAFLVPDLKNTRPYMGSADYADVLKQKLLSEFVIYHVTVLEAEEKQTQWLDDAMSRGYVNIVPVGGESSKIAYNGLHPIDFALLAKSRYFFQGAVCIPSRGKIPEENRQIDPWLEPRKMMQKENAGISYHVTQILFETGHLEQTLQYYHNLCETGAKEESRIVIGVSPILDEANLRFMERLGVIIPNEVKSFIFADNNPAGIAARSAEHITQMLLRFFEKYSNRGKFGVHVESVRHNGLSAYTDLFFQLRERLAQFWK